MVANLSAISFGGLPSTYTVALGPDVAMADLGKERAMSD